MIEINRNVKFEKALKKEWQYIKSREEHFCKSSKVPDANWKKTVMGKIPSNVRDGLEKAFSKAFYVVFDKGVGIIEKTYDKDDLIADYKVQDVAVELKKNRKELKKMRRLSGKRHMFNSAATTIEGIGLGVLGIGMPDIVAFLGVILKGVFETALQYGYDYTDDEEKYLILKMLEAALSKEEEWAKANAEVDCMLERETVIEKEHIDEQIGRTSAQMAMELLVMKFIQGLPVVGVLGGAFNPVYYNRIMDYVKLKYYKRYLIKKHSEYNGN